MARSALTAPAHRVAQRAPAQISSSSPNSTVQPDSAQSLDYGGGGLIDHRLPYSRFNSLGNSAAGCIAVGWNGSESVVVLDATPVAAATANIAALANAVSGTPVTLVSVSGGGVSVLAAPYTTLPFGNVLPTGSVVMGTATGNSGTVPAGAPGYMFVGARDQTAYYDPTTALTYALSVTGSASGTGGTFIVRGFDFYGQPMSENLVATAGATTANGVKAWKSITSITPQFSDAHQYSFGTQLIVGLHIALDLNAYMTEFKIGTGYTANPTITASLGSSTINTAATATNADVRGTFVPTAVREILTVTPTARRTNNPQSLGGMTVGLFGVTQFTQ
jgi:hypothetical protein